MCMHTAGMARHLRRTDAFIEVDMNAAYSMEMTIANAQHLDRNERKYFQ